MNKVVLCLIGALLWVSSPVAAEIVTPEIVNNLIVYEEPLTCEPDRVFLLREGMCDYDSPPYPVQIDICDRVMEVGRNKDYCDRWVGSVTGLNWPANAATSKYEGGFYTQAMDGPPPADPYEPCVDHVQFIEGTSEVKHKSFSYFVYDMTDKRGCQVISARLKLKASPFYSSSAQDGQFTAYLGIYEMAHSCENLTNDEKRACFESLVSDPTNNPIQFGFPLDPAEFPIEDHPDCPGHYPNYYKNFVVDVTESVRADLNDAGASGYVGFMIGSRGFGEHDIDYKPGIRTVGMTEFVLEVELGPCGQPPTPPITVPALSQWGLALFLISLLGISLWALKKRGRRNRDSINT